MRLLWLAVTLVLAAGQISAKARFANLKGTVQVYGDGKWIAATLATKLENGTAVQTAYNSTALIVFSSGGQMALRPNTKIILNDLPINPGTNRDVFLEHGQVSAFVKKSDGTAPNNFRIRTPTVTAGVRGSLLLAEQTGKTGKAEAVQSRAYFARALASSGIEMLKREMMKMSAKVAANLRLKAELLTIAKRGGLPGLSPAGLEKRIRQLDQQNQQLKVALSVGRRELVSLDAKVTALTANAEKIALLQKLEAEAVAQGKSSDKISGEIRQLREANDKLLTEVKAEYQQLAAMQPAFNMILAGVALAPATLEQLRTLTLQQGDLVVAADGRLVSPNDVVRISTRPASIVTVGQTGSEQKFADGNDDSKVGIGNDFQQLYNQINDITQPTTTGLPTLKKL